MQSVGEQLVFIGGSHEWGPGKLSDSQVCLRILLTCIQLEVGRGRSLSMPALQLDITLARVQEAMKGVKAVMTILRRSSVGQSGKAAGGREVLFRK